MSANLILIASYPKSGNTWVRLILETLRRGKAVSINDIDIGAYGFQRRQLFDALAPAEASNLLPEEIDGLLPDIYDAISTEADGTVFLKVHDCLRHTRDGRWLFPPSAVRGVIYVSRHPFDVAVSYAHHRGIPVADVVRLMGDESYVIAPTDNALSLPLAERPGSWSRHVGSWLEGAPYPVTLARYEDLYFEPAKVVATLAAAAGLDASMDAIGHAIDATRFERLRDEESKLGFREKPRSSPAFFRSGSPESWRTGLDAQLCQQLISGQGQMMQQLGYETDGKAMRPWPCPLAQGRSLL